jgi:DNA-binding response OmpR family regulator
MHAAIAYSDSFHETVQPDAPLIVVADADLRLRDELVRRLSDGGYDVIPLETGSQLMQYLYNEGVHDVRPDLVICGAHLEGIDGTQVCKISRAQDSLVPFIVLARDGEAANFDALELIDDAVVLQRPLDFNELRDSVAQLVGSPAKAA